MVDVIEDVCYICNDRSEVGIHGIGVDLYLCNKCYYNKVKRGNKSAKTIKQEFRKGVGEHKEEASKNGSSTN